jgi:hypothetical protein
MRIRNTACGSTILLIWWWKFGIQIQQRRPDPNIQHCQNVQKMRRAQARRAELSGISLVSEWRKSESSKPNRSRRLRNTRGQYSLTCNIFMINTGTFVYKKRSRTYVHVTKINLINRKKFWLIYWRKKVNTPSHEKRTIKKYKNFRWKIDPNNRGVLNKTLGTLKRYIWNEIFFSFIK